MTGLPATIGRYRIDAVLGTGAMGIVYKAHDPDIDRPVAIKLVHTALLNGTQRAEYIRRFRREAQSVGRCSHSNIVALHDIAVHEGDPYLVMEFVEGVALDAMLARTPHLPPVQAVAIAAQVLDALACAHAAGIVHRDIKPGNILVRPDGQAKVTDFGISRVAASDLTQVGAVIGTPAFMSPEQISGEPCGPASDLFSLASVLYVMLSGRRPFPGDSVAAIAAKLLRGRPDPIEGIPASLAATLARAHAQRPQDRFPNAAAMAAAVRATTQPHANFDDTVIQVLETRLAHVVGPMAGMMVQRAARESASVDDLRQKLAAGIDHPEDRARFLGDTINSSAGNSSGVHSSAGHSSAGHSSSGHSSGGALPARPPPGINAAETEAIVHDLARHLGPIARVLVQRAAAHAVSATALREQVAREIKDDSERRDFLAGRPHNPG